MTTNERKARFGGFFCRFASDIMVRINPPGPLFKRGALEPVLPDWWQSFPGPFLSYVSRTPHARPLRAFVDHIKAVGRES
ncbi:hypothetical protein [Breoghania sp. L-A4]|uniref:hypothetical protein n=1 Tax=Breoghania sp. L-A4 TaxID=2304600 RepID=UPI001967A98D|nr:hypothetical protein [Breoghania sp. L-A4]